MNFAGSPGAPPFLQELLQNSHDLKIVKENYGSWRKFVDNNYTGDFPELREITQNENSLKPLKKMEKLGLIEQYINNFSE